MRFIWRSVVVFQMCVAVISQETTATGSSPKCGVSNPGGLIYRFMSSSLADFAEYPWMAAIIKKSDAKSDSWSQKDYVAAGSIIHPSVVLTTAHWIGDLKPDEIKIRAGEWDTSSDEEVYAHEERNVNKILKNPNYSSDSSANDIALLFLDKPYDFGNAPHIAATCLGQSLPDPGSECFGMGWGYVATNTSKILKKLRVKLLSRDDCEEMMRKTRLGESFQLHDSLFCATSEDCQGDKGAPLVCPVTNDNTRLTLVGASAYRVSEPGSPCLYVNAPLFLDWIAESLTKEGFDTSTYTYRQ